MCWICDDPRLTVRDYLEECAAMIARNGWMVQGVEGGRYPPWAYTVGLTGYDLPELVITGMLPERAAGILNQLARGVLDDGPPVPGGRVPLPDGTLAETVRLTEPSAHLRTAVGIYGGRIRARQLVHPDDRGHWPWDPGYRAGRGGQPVLGMRGG
ncbi:DUF4262 domain-containing protein [Amycolatopsis suaedae]|uniref:DUF4262 domain-containing protein n=1 Tax=Amycolatopsis suaedae TaxID=2510978 RepID=A0A4Q7JAU6_9PSEU|nr:DUF4262 domain-containing protein [Amycolatopsis suaedae]RZQ63344.1 DUF4262 domain-containing protein [Amycolatopsis suaedae]